MTPAANAAFVADSAQLTNSNSAWPFVCQRPPSSINARNATAVTLDNNAVKNAESGANAWDREDHAHTATTPWPSLTYLPRSVPPRRLPCTQRR